MILSGVLSRRSSGRRYTGFFTMNLVTSLPSAAWPQDVDMSADGQVMMLTCYEHLYVSLDRGATWALKRTGGAYHYGVCDSTGQYQAMCGQGGALLSSSDYGQTWTERVTSSSYWIAMAASKTSGTMVAAQYGSAATGKVYVSLDYGVTWNTITFPFSLNVQSCAVLGARIILTTDSTTGYYSDSGGANWYAFTCPVASGILNRSPSDKVILGKYGGRTYRSGSQSLGTAWANEWDALRAITHTYGISSDSSGNIIADVSETATAGAYISYDGGKTWGTNLSYIRDYSTDVCVSYDGGTIVELSSGRSKVSVGTRPYA